MRRVAGELEQVLSRVGEAAYAGGSGRVVRRLIADGLVSIARKAA
jgi:hypothetical protein